MKCACRGVSYTQYINLADDMSYLRIQSPAYWLLVLSVRNNMLLVRFKHSFVDQKFPKQTSRRKKCAQAAEEEMRGLRRDLEAKQASIDAQVTNSDHSVFLFHSGVKKREKEFTSRFRAAIVPDFCVPGTWRRLWYHRRNALPSYLLVSRTASINFASS